MTQLLQREIIQSPADSKQYRHITLKNELQVLLVHDPAIAAHLGGVRSGTVHLLCAWSDLPPCWLLRELSRAHATQAMDRGKAAKIHCD